MTEKTLLLWDIDGTLVTTAGAGRRAIDKAFRDLHGWEQATKSLFFDGRTDPWIVEETFRAHGFVSDRGGEARRAVLSRYVEHLEDELENPPPGKPFGPLPGIERALEVLADRGDCSLALLTGNIEPGAKRKLERFGLWKYFRFGAYGDDAEERPALLPVALGRAANGHGLAFEPRHAVVLGDTPRDVEVGRAHGARTIAVATGGGYRRADLALSEPTHIFDDLSCTEALLEAIFG